MSSCARLPSSNALRCYAQTAPIRIPVAYEVGDNNKNKDAYGSYHKTQYGLTENTFDPSKFSPPAQFLIKLQMRIGSYASTALGINDISRNSE
jgi:hypothetical protein